MVHKSLSATEANKYYGVVPEPLLHYQVLDMCDWPRCTQRQSVIMSGLCCRDSHELYTDFVRYLHRGCDHSSTGQPEGGSALPLTCKALSWPRRHCHRAQYACGRTSEATGGSHMAVIPSSVQHCHVCEERRALASRTTWRCARLAVDPDTVSCHKPASNVCSSRIHKVEQFHSLFVNRKSDTSAQR